MRIFFLIILAVSACQKKAPSGWLGYVEGEFRQLATLEAGVVEKVFVKKGDFVEKGTILTSLEQTDTQKNQDELKASYTFLLAEYERNTELFKKDIISKEEFQKTKSEYETIKAKFEAVSWKISKHSIIAPEDGYIQNILREVGEVANSQNAVIYFLPKKAVKARFFVPEEEFSKIHLADPISLRADGVEVPISAKITFVSNKPEFTPPIIYSEQIRQKLVFMVEAEFIEGKEELALKPGQPITVLQK